MQDDATDDAAARGVCLVGRLHGTLHAIWARLLPGFPAPQLWFRFILSPGHGPAVPGGGRVGEDCTQKHHKVSDSRRRPGPHEQQAPCRRRRQTHHRRRKSARAPACAGSLSCDAANVRIRLVACCGAAHSLTASRCPARAPVCSGAVPSLTCTKTNTRAPSARAPKRAKCEAAEAGADASSAAPERGAGSATKLAVSQQLCFVPVGAGGEGEGGARSAPVGTSEREGRHGGARQEGEREEVRRGAAEAGSCKWQSECLSLQPGQQVETRNTEP